MQNFPSFSGGDNRSVILVVDFYQMTSRSESPNLLVRQVLINSYLLIISHLMIDHLTDNSLSLDNSRLTTRNLSIT